MTDRSVAHERMTALIDQSAAGRAIDRSNLDNCREDEPVTATDHFGIGVESYTDSYTVLRLRGEFDLTSQTSLEQAIADVIARSSAVVVDLSGVTFLYSGAAAVLLDAAAEGTHVRLSAPSRSAAVVLAALGTDSHNRHHSSSLDAA